MRQRRSLSRPRISHYAPVRIYKSLEKALYLLKFACYGHNKSSLSLFRARVFNFSDLAPRLIPSPTMCPFRFRHILQRGSGKLSRRRRRRRRSVARARALAPRREREE